jgi:hypothetical protein
MNPRDQQRYPNLIALLDARRRHAKTCRYCGLVNAAWLGPGYTRDHPSCVSVVTKRLEALKEVAKAKRERVTT